MKNTPGLDAPAVVVIVVVVDVNFGSVEVIVVGTVVVEEEFIVKMIVAIPTFLASSTATIVIL